MCSLHEVTISNLSGAERRAVLEEMQRGIIDLLEDCVEVSDVYDAALKAEERPGASHERAFPRHRIAPRPPPTPTRRSMERPQQRQRRARLP